MVGFTAGWLLWFAYTVACSLYALGFAGYFWEFFLKYTPELAHGIFGLVGENGAGLVITLVIGITFVGLNVRGAEVTGMTELISDLTTKCTIAELEDFYNDPRLTAFLEG